MKNSGYPDRIKEIRHSLKMNQIEFAVYTKTLRSAISEFESGKREPTREFLETLSNMGISIDWFLTGEGEMFLSKQEKPLENTPKTEEKHPLIASLGAFVDQRLEKIENKIAHFEKIESKIADIEKRLEKSYSNVRDFGTYTSEPEPEYGEDTGNIAHADDLDREDIAKTVRFPYVHNLAAGPLREPISDPDEFFDASPPPRYTGRPEDYVVAGIKGTSMTEAGIPDGSKVLLRLSGIPMHGRIQAIEFIGEVSLKELQETPSGWRICYRDGSGKIIEAKQGDGFHVLGDFIKVVEWPV